MKSFRKITFPAIAAALALLSTTALASTETVNGIQWTFNISNNTASVGSGHPYGDHAVPTSTSGAIAIPSKLGGYPVTSIGDSAFRSCTGLTSVTIPNSVTSIGGAAFAYCTGLTSVTIPDSVTTIGGSAFSGCTGLTSVTIPDSVTNIGSNAFYNCTSLTNVTIPDSVTSIGSSAFYGCTGLTSVTIPDITNIGDSAFRSCTGLTSVTIPDSVTTIGYAAFSNCTSLTSVTIPDSVTDIGNYAFSDCRGLTNVTIPNSVTSIGYGVFWDCTRLTSVTIPNSVTSIGSKAFYNCTSLTSVTIPDSVTSLSTTAFDGCNQLWTAWYRTLANLSANGGSPGGGSSGESKTVSLTVTNVIVHYVTQSLPGAAVTPPTNSTGIVNVMAEVTAGKPIAISQDWAAQYPAFEATFGTDFSAALTMETVKRDGSGNPMYVWQDYVAGTDPTDPASVFTASLTFDAETGAPLISWSPELSPAEAAKRRYTTSGKVRLTDPDWTPLDNDAAHYNFFRVTVEMK